MNQNRLLSEVRSHRSAILRMAGYYGVSNIRIFGSVARGEATEKSDVDFLVDIAEGKSLMDLVGFSQDVEDLLGRRADVLTEEALSPHLKDRIINESTAL